MMASGLLHTDNSQAVVVFGGAGCVGGQSGHSPGSDREADGLGQYSAGLGAGYAFRNAERRVIRRCEPLPRFSLNLSERSSWNEPNHDC